MDVGGYLIYGFKVNFFGKFYYIYGYEFSFEIEELDYDVILV